jgi:CheY-like chemotaxis protein
MSEKRVYMLTAKGNAELTGANILLAPEELKLLVLVDGFATVGEIARNAQVNLEVAAAATALEKLARGGYIADPDGSGAIDIKAFLDESLTGFESLQAKGFFVRIARRSPPRPPGAQKVTVLAVEDDPALTKLLKMYLQMEGYAVRVAASRAEINNAVREAPKPDVVLLDVVLPDGDGFEILQRLRAHPFTKDVPIIMTTARATREAVLNGLARGADGYVTKPFDMDVVLKAVKSVLGFK